MHQPSDKEAPSAEARSANEGSRDAQDIDFDSALFSDISLSQFFTSFTTGAALGDAASGTLTGSPPDTVAHRDGDSALCPVASVAAVSDAADAVVTSGGEHAAPSYYETSLYSLLAAFPTAQEGPSTSVATSVASSLQWEREASDTVVDTDAGLGGSQSNAFGLVDAASEQAGPALGESGDSTETEEGRGRRIAHLIRIVASVASRAVEPDESHQPSADATEYDARYLLVAVYKMLTTWGSDAGPMKLPKATFSKLAGGIHGDRFAHWNRHFQNGADAGLLSEAMAFWAGLGVGQRRDSEVVVDQLKALTHEAAPLPTLQDLADSPLYRTLSLRKLSGFTTAQLSKARQSRRGRAADDRAPRRFRGALSATTRAQGGDGREVGPAIVAGGSGTSDLRPRIETPEDSARRIARLIRMVASVATHAVELDESHRPIASEPEYDSRDLLAAAYKVLSGGAHKLRAEGNFSMSHFSRVAGIDRPKRFMAWNDESKARLTEPSAFWSSLGFDGNVDRAATMRALKALRDGAEPPPTLHDIAASPLYRKLYINNRYGINAVPRHWTKRIRRNAASHDDAPVTEMPQPAYAVSLDAVGSSTQSRPGATVDASGALEAVADTTPMQDDPAYRIAHLIRIASSAASGQLASDSLFSASSDQVGYDPRKVLAAAYAALSKGAGATGSKPNLSISRFSGLAGTIQGQRMIRWMRLYAGELDQAGALWESQGLGEGSDTEAILRALVSLHDRGTSAPTMQDFEGSAFYGRFLSTRPVSVDVPQTSQPKRRRTERAPGVRAYRASRQPLAASAFGSAAAVAQALPPPYSVPTPRVATVATVATVGQASLPSHGGASATMSYGDATTRPPASQPDWPYDLAPWSQTPVATEVLDAHPVDGPSWSDDALHWLHSGATSQMPGAVTGTRDAGNAPDVLAALPPDGSFDDGEWSRMLASLDAASADSGPEGAMPFLAAPASRPASPLAFIDATLPPSVDDSASDYAASTVSRSTQSSMLTLPSVSVTTTASQGAVAAPVAQAQALPAPAVAPGTIVFERGDTRITVGAGVDAELLRAIVREMLATPQTAPSAGAGAGQP